MQWHFLGFTVVDQNKCMDCILMTIFCAENEYFKF